MKVGIIGFGNMGRAIATGLRHNEPETELFVFDKSTTQTKGAAETVGAVVCTDLSSLCSRSDLHVISVKPQNTDDLLAELREFAAKLNVFSIVAGKSISYFRMGLGTNRVVRCMPNIAATVGKALVGMTIPSDADESLRTNAIRVAKAMGLPMEVPEELLAAVTGISGSGIAYVFAFVHALAMGGTKAGLPYPTALLSAIEVLEGAGALLKDSGEHPISLLSKVASPAGTTIAGIKALEEHAFTAGVMEAVEQAARRASELEH
ncbi:MAG TPA: pyrroline-5-carboxylate reductase [Spirochaetia bacterium]|nr:pyrroline-5-carboxylate reductase [Spirochaetia bacterium]